MSLAALIRILKSPTPSRIDLARAKYRHILPWHTRIGLSTSSGTFDRTKIAMLLALSFGLVACLAGALYTVQLSAKDSPQELQERGKFLMDQGDYKAAIAALKQAVALQPSSADGFYELGYAYFHSGENSSAIQAWNEALRLQPSMEKARLAISFMGPRAPEDSHSLREQGVLTGAAAPSMPTSEEIVADQVWSMSHTPFTSSPSESEKGSAPSPLSASSPRRDFERRPRTARSNRP
jgi:tetratricopeptide (TPR) repeat protein